MDGYLYVADEAGAEIEGSRRDLRNVATRADFRAIYLQLEAVAGEGCYVVDSHSGRRFDA